MRIEKEARTYVASVAAGMNLDPQLRTLVEHAFQAGVNFERARTKALEKSLAQK